MFRQKILIYVLLSLAFAPVAMAQTDCPTIVKTALQTVDDNCSIAGRNQVCYGNIHLAATPQDGKSLAFEKSGDIANVTDVRGLQLSSMSFDDTSWGVALMKLQANLPDTLPGQNVALLLFGNVEINRPSDNVELPMTAKQGVNVRQNPTTQTNNIIASLGQGREVTANGRLQDSSWLRVKLDDGLGWVAADFLASEGDIIDLAVVESGSPVYGPMQAFTFQSGIGDRPCAEAPDSGILIQTPSGAVDVNLNINGVEIALGSTLYLQAQPQSLMTVTVLQGHAMLTADGKTQLVPTGTFSRVQLDANGYANGTPSIPKPYDVQVLQSLPLNLSFFDPIEIVPPPTNPEIKATLEAALTAPTQVAPAPQANPATNNGNPVPNDGSLPSGIWKQTNVVTFNTCDPTGQNAVGGIHVWPSSLTFSEDRQNLTFNDSWETRNYFLSHTGNNVYQGMFDGNLTLTFTFTSQTTFTFSWVGIFGDQNNGGCTYILDGNGVFER